MCHLQKQIALNIITSIKKNELIQWKNQLKQSYKLFLIKVEKLHLAQLS